MMTFEEISTLTAFSKKLSSTLPLVVEQAEVFSSEKNHGKCDAAKRQASVRPHFAGPTPTGEAHP
jgi:hypothetical protein